MNEVWPPPCTESKSKPSVKQYWIRLLPEQPLCLDDDHVIPAAALRGAIANVLLGSCVPGHQHDTGPCSAECRYWSLFGEGRKLFIGPAYAATGDETQPFLATARTCSRFPGFTIRGGHGIFDIAIRQWIFEQACAEPQRLLAPFSQRCPTCNAPLIACEGLFTRHAEREFASVGEVSSPVEMTFTAQGRARRNIVMRYNVTARTVNRGIYYVARLGFPDHVDGLLRQAVEGGLWIGGRRSRGMGGVRVELIPYAPDSPPLAERIARFNQAVRAEHRFYTAMDPAHPAGEDGEWYFTLDLHEAAYPAYEAVPTLVPLTSALLPSVVAVRQWLSPSIGGGWHAAAGLPRRTQIGASGVILYRVPAEANRMIVEEMLEFMEAEGVGIGRERGCGAVTICVPFHLNLEPL
jgi:CRISPR-associated protein Csx10